MVTGVLECRHLGWRQVCGQSEVAPFEELCVLQHSTAELGPAPPGPDVVLETQKCPAMSSDLLGWVGSAVFAFSEQGETPSHVPVTSLRCPQVCEPHLCCAQSS